MSGADDDPGERRRVYAKIAPLILAYSEHHAGETFHAETLRQHVLDRVPDIAPDSPGRILRALRLERRLDYVVIDRRHSLYQFRIPEPPEEPPMAKVPKPPAPPPPPPPPPRWDSDHTCYLTGRAHIDKAAALGATAEAHWGCGRLRLLVSDELRAKFDSQRFKLQQAIEHGELQDVIHEANRMALAWIVLDKTVRAAGHPPLSVTVWEVRLEDGSVAAIVQDDSVAKEVVANDRAMAVFTLEEIGKLLSHYQGVVNAKLTFPGATVEHVRRSVPDPLDRKVEEDVMPF